MLILVSARHRSSATTLLALHSPTQDARCHGYKEAGPPGITAAGRRMISCVVPPRAVDAVRGTHREGQTGRTALSKSTILSSLSAATENAYFPLLEKRAACQRIPGRTRRSRMPRTSSDKQTSERGEEAKSLRFRSTAEDQCRSSQDATGCSH
ncbi:hypothetical protein VTK73DRAFT_1511 [Phialemonium thermophilum]|uniref:Uncharacterized protein n=1 Tax=Phialemonium thermophilum TaxID=223376 RepID=A0ABR3VTF4_9PEZI